MELSNCMPLAYIDPGSGSLMLQFLIGGMLGILFLIKGWLKAMWKKIARKPGSDT